LVRPLPDDLLDAYGLSPTINSSIVERLEISHRFTDRERAEARSVAH